jgi:hypothetical protein
MEVFVFDLLIRIRRDAVLMVDDKIERRRTLRAWLDMHEQHFDMVV